MKKRIISMFLIVSIVVSIFAIGVVSSSAAVAAAPNVSVTNYYTGIKVSWSKVTNARNYVVYYQRAGSGWSHDDVFGTSYYLPNLKSGSTYYIQVRSIGNGGTYGNFSRVFKVKYISQPTGFGGRMINRGKNLQMYWNKVTGAKKYQLVRWDPNAKRWISRYVGSGTSFVDSGANGVASGKFIYQVRAIGERLDNVTWASYWSNQAHAVVTPQIDIYNVSNVSVSYKTGWFGVKNYYYHYNIQWSNEGYNWEVAFYTTANHRTPAKRVTVNTHWYEFDDEDMTKRYDMVVVRHKFDGTCYNKGQGLYYIPVHN